MDEWELFAGSEVPTCSDNWTVIQPTSKALPAPPALSRSFAPRIRSPFQVTDISASSSSSNVAPAQRARPLTIAPSLPRPSNRFTDVGSLPFPDHEMDLNGSVGLPAPEFSQRPPTSLLHGAVDTDPIISEPDFQMLDTGNVQTPFRQSGTGLGKAPKQSNVASALTRIRLASKSPLVWELWLQFSSALISFSTVLQQLASSVHHKEHSERFLNQFAATTLMRYMQCILKFLQLCQDLHVDIQDLTEAQLADLLICGDLARRSDGSGPKCSVTIKALRWCCKQLGVQSFASAFGSLINSFERQKIPADRKESLPYPLFILMKWERRVLQAQASMKEIIILGGLLLLCWSGLRFSDLQRSLLSSWVLDTQTLRGATWRAKTCTSATPFGVHLAGLLSQGTFTWVHRFLQTLDHLYQNEESNSIDFAIPAFGNQEEPIQPFDAMTYSEALYYARYFMKLPWSAQASLCHVDPSSYTIHGLKATLLSWAAQADIAPEDRRMHGKHKPAQMSVQLYSRDDIIGSIRLQQALVRKISQGWKPATPLGRGGQSPLLEPNFTIEKFKKDVSSMEWKFFKFQSESALQVMVDDANISDEPQLAAEESSDDSSATTSSDSSDSDQQQQPLKKSRVGCPQDHISAEECIFGLHRKTWHVMIAAHQDTDQLPEWQGLALKTARGRNLHHSRVHVRMEVDLDPPNSLCSHAGCRKGFTSVGVMD